MDRPGFRMEGVLRSPANGVFFFVPSHALLGQIAREKIPSLLTEPEAPPPTAASDLLPGCSALATCNNRIDAQSAHTVPIVQCVGSGSCLYYPVGHGLDHLTSCYRDQTADNKPGVAGYRPQ